MTEPTRISLDMPTKSEWPGVDGVIAALADRQHGVVARRQLLAAGVAAHAIQARRGLGRLHTIHHGVYAVGHRNLTREGRWMAAVLAGGPEAVLSHRAAAALHGLRPYGGPEVTAPVYRARPRITVYTSTLPEDEITLVDGIPVTIVPRTLLDLASVLPPHQLEQAMNQAEIQGLHDPLSVPDLIARYPRRKGVGAIKTILETDPVITRKELEARFRVFLRSARLPTPRFNFSVVGYECDCVWPEHRLIVELDGRATHATRAAFERDRERDRILTAAAWRVIRITWRQLHRTPERVATDLRRLLVG
jgi:very-short-patch-repair endonuclease